MRWKIMLTAAALLTAAFITPAHALEYTFAGADNYLFGQPTSDDTIYEWTDPNVDRSKNTALILPGFGTPTSYLPGSGTYLTPNLVPGALSGGLANQTGGAGGPDGGYPTVDTGAAWTGSSYVGFTEVTSDLYYSGGYLAVLKIPSLGVNVKVYQGTDTDALAKGAGHFEGTSIWDGNCVIAGHNRGTHGIFGGIHTLSSGDIITLTTVLGTRTYAVISVTKVSVYDISGLESSATNMITLYTCVADQPDYRWCVRAVAG